MSIDAMGCQKEIASTIRARHADYLLAVKNNQRTLRRAVEDAFADVPTAGFEHTDRGHGRVVLQHIQVIENTKQVDNSTWVDCKRLGRVVSFRVECNKRQVIETRYYISSAELTKIRKDNGPRNITLIRKIILNMRRGDTKWPKTSLKGRRKMAGWDDDERMRVRGIKPL